MGSLPVAIESSAQREAAARVRADLSRMHAAPLVWGARLIVLVVGAPVAALGVSAGLLMARQDHNDNRASLAALTNRIERRVVECVARSHEPLPDVVRVDVLHAEQPHVNCDGECPGFDCIVDAAIPLVRQAPPGFAATVALDLSNDRLFALDATLAAAAPARADGTLSIAVTDDAAGYQVSCARAPAVFERVRAVFRVDVDAERVASAARAVIARCPR